MLFIPLVIGFLLAIFGWAALCLHRENGKKAGIAASAGVLAGLVWLYPHLGGVSFIGALGVAATLGACAWWTDREGQRYTRGEPISWLARKFLL